MLTDTFMFQGGWKRRQVQKKNIPTNCQNEGLALYFSANLTYIHPKMKIIPFVIATFEGIDCGDVCLPSNKIELVGICLKVWNFENPTAASLSRNHHQVPLRNYRRFLLWAVLYWSTSPTKPHHITIFNFILMVVTWQSIKINVSSLAEL